MYATIFVDHPRSWIITHARFANVMRRVSVAEIAQVLRCIVQVANMSLFERGVHQLLQAYQALRLFIPDFLVQD